MRRKAIMALLALGVVGGFGSGFAHMAHWRNYRQQHQQEWSGAGGGHPCWGGEAAAAQDFRTPQQAAPSTTIVPVIVPILIPQGAPVAAQTKP